MKRHFKTFSSLIAAVLLLCTFTLPGGAAALQKDKAVNYIRTQMDGYTVKQSVSPQNYQAMQSSLAKQGLSKREMNRQILKETGFTRENDPAFEAILDAMEGGSSFEVITQYIKETPSGQKIQMRKESFERAVMEEASKQNRQLRAPSEDYGGTEEPPSSYDGYVRMAVLYVHTVKGTEHYYGSFGTLEWVIMPITRMTDAMSLYADDLSWNNKNSNNSGDYGFFWTADYTERYAATNKTYQRSESEERDAHTVERFHDGFYYKFHLPSDAVLSGGQIIYTRFQITICGLGELKNNSTNSFNITLKYAHTRLRISSDLSFSWSTGGKYPGVTFSLAPSIGTTYYGLPCKVS